MCHLTCYRSSGKIAGGTDADLAIEHDPYRHQARKQRVSTLLKKKRGDVAIVITATLAIRSVISFASSALCSRISAAKSLKF